MSEFTTDPEAPTDTKSAYPAALPSGAPRTIRSLCERSHAIAKEKGWLEEKRTTQCHMLLMISEAIEGFEDYRSSRGVAEIYFEGSKPCGIPIEIADVVIRICQYAGTEGAPVVEGLYRFHKFEETSSPGIEGDLESFLGFAVERIVDFKKCMVRGDLELAADALGDVIDESLRFSKLFGIDLWGAIEMKEAYNRTRPRRHGDKRC